MIQATYNFARLHGVMVHGKIQNLILPFGAESIKGSMVKFASCLNFCQVVGECARVGGGSIPGSKAEGTDSKYVGSKAAHRANT